MVTDDLFHHTEDVRPQNGFLYGLGYNGDTGKAQLYVVSHRSGRATPIGTFGTFVAADGTTPVPIAGVHFGFDVDPTIDRVRVVTDAGQNFRMDPNTGAFIDGDLGGPGAIPGLNMDGAINGATTSAAGAAYTNNRQNATVTTLYMLDAVSHALHIRDPTESGTQTTTMPVTVNGSTLDFAPAAGFDILPGVDVTASNSVAAGTGLAALTVGGITSLYTIDLTTGAAARIGPIGDGGTFVHGLALEGAAVPNGWPAIALTTTNTLLRFNTAQVAAVTMVAVSGLVAGETLVGIDWRPRTGQLFALGFNRSRGHGAATLYRLDPQTGAAEIIGFANGVADGTDGSIYLAIATSFGFDFDPTTDQIRVTTNDDQNLRLDPDTGTLAAIDFRILGVTGLVPRIIGAAYTNSYDQTPAGGATTLYTLGSPQRVYIQNPPDLGLEIQGVDLTVDGAQGQLQFDDVAGFDIPPGVSVSAANTAAAGPAYAALKVRGITELYAIELSSGAATSLGLIGPAGATLSGLAVGDGPWVPTTVELVIITVRRSHRRLCDAHRDGHAGERHGDDDVHSRRPLHRGVQRPADCRQRCDVYDDDGWCREPDIRGAVSGRRHPLGVQVRPVFPSRGLLHQHDHAHRLPERRAGWSDRDTHGDGGPRGRNGLRGLLHRWSIRGPGSTERQRSDVCCAENWRQGRIP